jgi:hypothetical protein
MGWVLRFVETGIEGRPCIVNVMKIDHPGGLGDHPGFEEAVLLRSFQQS